MWPTYASVLRDSHNDFLWTLQNNVDYGKIKGIDYQKKTTITTAGD